MPEQSKDMNIDLLSVSSHKLYGPKGVGMLYIKNQGKREGWGIYIGPMMHGGSHEKKMRPSTVNVPGIAGFAKAVDIAKSEMDEEAERLILLRDKIIKYTTENIEDVFLNGHPTRRLPNHVHLGIRYIEGEAILLGLDMEGIGASTGSACSSKSLEPSHVLLAIGLKPEETHGSLRISLGKFTTEEEVDYFLEKLPPIVERLRMMSPLKKGDF